MLKKVHERFGAVSLELLLWIVAAGCLGSVLRAGTDRVFAEHAAAKVGASGTRATGSTAQERASANGWTTAVSGDVVGRLEIPAISLSVPITVGIEAESLVRGVGHIQGTAMPGGLGTLGLAGHRDTYFRPLRKIATGMDVRVIDATGTYHYVVDSTEIVTPEQVEVLAIQNRPEMTLVTCYPFDFIGQAPKRFIVHAHLVSLSPDESPR